MSSCQTPRTVSGFPYFTLDLRHELRRGCLGCAAIAAFIVVALVVLLLLLKSF